MRKFQINKHTKTQRNHECKAQLQITIKILSNLHSNKTTNLRIMLNKDNSTIHNSITKIPINRITMFITMLTMPKLIHNKTMDKIMAIIKAITNNMCSNSHMFHKINILNRINNQCSLDNKHINRIINLCSKVKQTKLSMLNSNSSHTNKIMFSEVESHQSLDFYLFETS